MNCRILGPTAEYRRKLIYSPKGRKQQTKFVSVSKGYNKGKAIDRYDFTKPTKSKVNKGATTDRIAIRTGRGKRAGKTFYQGQVAKAIQEIVVQNVKRQFRDIRVGYRFVRSKEKLDLLNSPTWRPDEANIHIPELWMGIKVKHGR